MEKIDKLKLYNADCMEVIKDYEDNYFDLAIVDPPYGINFAKTYTTRTQKDRRGLRHKSKEWDEGIPTDEYFIELQRVSKIKLYGEGIIFLIYGKMGVRGLYFGIKVILFLIFRMGNSLGHLLIKWLDNLIIDIMVIIRVAL